MGLEELEEKIFSLIKEYNEKDEELIKKAYLVAMYQHEQIKRKSGEPYIIHPEYVAYFLLSHHADADTVCAGLLHDVVEDTNITSLELALLFNKTVADLVESVSKMNISLFQNKSEQTAANVKKLIHYFYRDPRTIILKLYDRLHNMLTLQYMRKEKQIEIAKETLSMYVPITYYLGMYELKNRLEDLSFKYIDEEQYAYLKEKEKNYKKENVEQWLTLIKTVEDLLKENNIELQETIRFNLKNTYGVKKRLDHGHDFEDIHDMVAFRIIVSSVSDCYKVKNLLKEKFPSYIEHEKDYIASPKTNQYQSLHITVNYLNNPIQFQIRTLEMELKDTSGIASFWKLYPNCPVEKMRQELINNIYFYQMIPEIESNSVNDQEYLKTLQKEFFHPQIIVHDKSGKQSIELPVGSTIVDFAYRVNNELANHLDKAIVNGEEKPLNYKLKAHDYIELVFKKNNMPPPCEYAFTTYALRRIKKAKKEVL